MPLGNATLPAKTRSEAWANTSGSAAMINLDKEADAGCAAKPYAKNSKPGDSASIASRAMQF
jgi:hypothetical protein